MKRTLILPLPVLEGHARTIASLFVSRPDVRRIGALIGPGLSRAMPARHLRDVLRQYHRRCGACIGVQPLQVPIPNWGRFELSFDRGYSATLDVRVEPDDLQRIEGLNLSTPVKRNEALWQVEDALAALPGRTGWQLAWLDGPRLQRLAGLRDDVPLAVGSSSKLYILGELMRAVKDGRVEWSTTIPLQERYTAIPTGMLQAWPLGTPMTVQSLAALMISLSDNTATEHLLFALGREKVEKFQAVAGHGRPDLNVPYLSIMEMVGLKNAPGGGLASRYMKGSVEERRRILQGLDARGPNDVMVAATPKHVTDIEWFASPADLCRCMHWILQSDDPIALDLLAINTGIEFPPRCWPRVGYKGGSEAGVLNATYLVRDAEAQWYALSVGWNRDDAGTDEKTLFRLVRDLVDLAPSLRKGTAAGRPGLLRRLLRWR